MSAEDVLSEVLRCVRGYRADEETLRSGHRVHANACAVFAQQLMWIERWARSENLELRSEKEKQSDGWDGSD